MSRAFLDGFIRLQSACEESAKQQGEGKRTLYLIALTAMSTVHVWCSLIVLRSLLRIRLLYPPCFPIFPRTLPTRFDVHVGGTKAKPTVMMLEWLDPPFDGTVWCFGPTHCVLGAFVCCNSKCNTKSLAQNLFTTLCCISCYTFCCSLHSLHHKTII